MTRNQTLRERGRAVALAAIMMLSMVAAGATLVAPAAAQDDPVDVQFDFDPAEPDPGDGITITATLSADDAVIEAVSGGDTDFENIEVDDIGAEGDDLAWNLFSYEDNQEEVTVTWTADVPDGADEGEELGIEFNVAVDGEDDLVTVSDSVTVAEEDEEDPDPPEEPADAVDPTEIDVIFVGEEFTVDVDVLNDEFDAGLDDGSILQLRAGVPGGDSDQVDVVQVTEDDGDLTATFTLDPDADSAGEFHFFATAEDDFDNVFDVEVQDLNAAFAADVTTADPVTDLAINSDNYVAQEPIRGDAFNVEINSESFDHEDLAEIFGVDEDDDADEDDPIVVSVAPGDALEAELPDDVADYEFDVDAVATTGADTAEVSVVEPDDVAIALSERNVVEEIGDVASIGVEPSGTDQVLLQLTLGDDYQAEVQVTAPDVGEEVTVNYNTFAAGNADEAFSVVEDDGSVEVVDITPLDDGQLPAERLQITADVLQAGFGSDRADRARGSLSLQDRSTDSLTAHHAPAGTPLAGLGDVNDFLEAQTPSNVVAIDEADGQADTAGFFVQASGIFGYLEGNEGLNADQGLSFELTETDVPRFEDPQTFDLSSNAVDLVADGDNNRFFVAVDPLADDLEVGETYDVEFAIDGGENPYVDDDEIESVETELTIVDAETTISVVEEPYQVTADENAVVDGESNLAPGTELSVEVAGSAFFEAQDGIVVDDNGEFAAEFDLTGEEDLESVEVIPPLGDEDSVEAVFDDVAERDTVDDEEELRQQISELEEQIADLEDENADLEDENADLADEIDALTDELETVTNERDDLQNDLAEAEAVIGGLEDQVADLEDENVDLENQVADLEDENADLQDQIADLEDQIDELEEEDPEDDDDDGAGFGIAAALVALIGAALLAVRRRD